MEVHRALRGVVLCEGAPFDTLRDLTRHGSSTWNQGYAGSDHGEEMNHSNILVLRRPLEISGALTSSIIGELGKSNDEFEGLIYGRFHGDFKKVVKDLGLRESKSSVGKYTREIPDPNTGCPKTIGLTPKEGDEFLLGCGWCNGG
ncbi:MAG: hypothetical protein ACKVQC_07095 [Elusimicrobiota bacterium]